MGRLTTFIACRNHGKFLAQAADSVMAQTVTPDQLILINDGSNDFTYKTMLQLRDKYPSTISLITHDIPQGHIASYNEGIRMSRGNVIHLMAADDFLTWNGYYDQALQWLEDPQVAFVSCGLRHVRKDGWAWKLTDTISVPPFSGPVSSALVLKALQKFGNFINGGGTLVRRSKQMEAGPYDAALPYSADFLNWINILKISQKAAFLDRPIYGYRRHDSQMTSIFHAPETERMRCNEILAECVRAL